MDLAIAFISLRSRPSNQRTGGIEIADGTLITRDIIGGDQTTNIYGSEQSPTVINSTVLSNYFDQIHEYLSDPNFRGSAEGIQVRALARAASLGEGAALCGGFSLLAVSMAAPG